MANVLELDRPVFMGCSVGGLLAHTDLGDVPVSRRHSRELRERLLQAAQRGQLDRQG